MLAPITLFVYKRLEHTKHTVESLLQNSLAAESELIVYCDAAKNPADLEKVNQVQRYVATIDGFKSVKVVQRAANFGLARSIITGVSEICAQYGKVIVLEDDMVVSPYFLQYMNDALTVYAEHDRVGSIHGYTYPVKENLPNTFFMRGGDCWGWATWQRAWHLFEHDGEKLLKALKQQHECGAFNLDDTVPNIEMLKAQIAGKNDSWAIRWHASLFLAQRYTLYPGQSLVQNIGTDESGTHCESTGVYHVELKNTPLNVQAIPVIECDEAKEAFKQFFQTLRPGFWSRLRNKIQRNLSSQATT